MISKYKGLTALCIPLIALLMLAGCEDPGSVGGDFVEKSELAFDTLSVTGVEVQNYSGYSGKMSFVTMGKYDDPLFGEINAVAMLKPSISGATLPDTINEDYTMWLEIQVDSVNTYGDTLSEATYDIYEITSPWEGTNFKFDSELLYDESALVGTITLTDEDHTFLAQLSDDWKNTYANYFHNEGADADSSYRYEFRGLALVPQDATNKINYPRISASKFVAINNVDPDTSNIPIRDWAYSLSRNVALDDERIPLHSTLEGIMKLDLSGYMSAVDGKNFIRADLVFYEDTTLQSSLAANHSRPAVNSLNMDIGYESDAAYEFQFGSIEASGSKNSQDRSFRVNITNYLNNSVFGSESRRELYIGIGSNSGALRSTLLYGETAPVNLTPKLIITSLVGAEE